VFKSHLDPSVPLLPPPHAGFEGAKSGFYSELETVNCEGELHEHCVHALYLRAYLVDYMKVGKHC
jgi:hypothetical protein